MTSDEITIAATDNAGLGAFPNSRELVRLVQCSHCSQPLRTPVTLPCGNSLCRSCLPEPHVRENISYPSLPGRQQGIVCPFSECQQVHPLEDCCVNVVLLKLMEIIDLEVARSLSVAEGQPFIQLDEIPSKQEDGLDMSEKQSTATNSQTFQAGKLVSTFRMAGMGLLQYASDVSYIPNDNQRDAADSVFLAQLREASQKEVECHVCYNLMLDPTTTPCGHTFCRKCLTRILDHASHCPVCRRNLPLPSHLRHQSSNKRLVKLLEALCPEQIAARAEAVAQEENSAAGGFNTALFVCTLSFPSVPTFLHIFEPRYRLMIRRAEEGNGQFGMLPYNLRGSTQGSLGRVQFHEYGTMLQIETIHYYPDGRSLILTKGVSRFRVLEHGVLDGYIVGRVEKVEDVSLAEEEQLEAEETSQLPAESTDPLGEIERTPTADLLQICVDFVARAQQNSAGWLHRSILDVHGHPPDDPAAFPYWFASVLPIAEEEKLKLLQTTSLRQRLKITTRWIRRIEAQRW